MRFKIGDTVTVYSTNKTFVVKAVMLHDHHYHYGEDSVGFIEWFDERELCKANFAESLTKESAIDFLRKAGIIDEFGDLTENYTA